MPDRRAGAGPRAVVYVLVADAPRLLGALDGARLHPRTDEERALRALADLFNKSINLDPSTRGYEAAVTAVPAALAALGE